MTYDMTFLCTYYNTIFLKDTEMDKLFRNIHPITIVFEFFRSNLVEYEHVAIDIPHCSLNDCYNNMVIYIYIYIYIQSYSINIKKVNTNL